MAASLRTVSKAENPPKFSPILTFLYLRAFRDPDQAKFEFAYFLTGTHKEDEEQKGEHVENINLLRVRMPKLQQSQKTVIDYTQLDRRTQSKTQIVKQIPHEGEVLKCRQSIFGDKVASILTSGVVNIYSVESASKLGCLHGLTEESFCLDWSRKSQSLLASAAGSTVMVWDVAHNLQAGD